MKILIVDNYKTMSEVASDIIIKDINRKPRINICFATGKTPIGMYKNIVKAYRKNKVNFSKVVGFDLDEFYPISRGDKKSYFNYMHKNLFNKVNIKKENINLLNGEAEDWKKECLNYERKIRKNPIDLQILGVGVNGHIGFNEPGSSMKSKTRLVKLTHLKGNGLTLGVSNIMQAKKLILLASGKKKSKAIHGLVKGKISSNCPVSFLRKHKNLIVIVDKNAARLIR